MATVVGSTANIPALAQLGIGCIVSGPNPYTVAFQTLTPNPNGKALPSASSQTLPAGMLAAMTGLALPGQAQGFFTLFYAAALDYLRNGGT